ncbi:NAD(P)H-hydrate dehydratase [Gemmatimonadota bacterium]
MTKIPVLDAVQAASWDEIARDEANIPSRVLMESAGRATAAVIAREYGPRLREGVLVVAGHGNNGGDGWVVARALHAVGVRTYVADESRNRSEDCEANRKLALDAGVERLDPDGTWPAVGVVVDALLGTGASGRPRGAVGALAERLMKMGTPVVAIDGPTGLDLSSGEAAGPVRAGLTVTFGGARRGHLLEREWCGKILVVEMGFSPPDPSWPILVDDRWAAEMLPPFQADMHKGSRGRVLVVGGDEGMAGAAIFAAKTAFAAGAGLVKIAAHDKSIQVAQETLPDALTVSTVLGPDLEPNLVEALDWADAVVLGPGMGRGETRTFFVGAILESCEKRVVMDADALQVGLDVLSTGSAARVFTPHAGEFAAVFPDLANELKSDRFAAATNAARAAAAAAAPAAPVVLLKGVPTVLAQEGCPLRVVASGNPSLATGGSGDLLAGFIGAFLAGGLDPLDAAALGAQVLGRAAELASAEKTARATRPGDVATAAQAYWRLLADLPAPEPPILAELAAPRLV